MISLERWEEAIHQLERIERYFSKNWMDEDYPVDAIWDAMSSSPPGKAEQEEQPCAPNLM